MPQSFNRYAYVQNDPVNFVDPSGLLNWPINLGNVGDVTIYAGPSAINDFFFRFGDSPRSHPIEREPREPS